jgi:hypothetical protein
MLPFAGVLEAWRVTFFFVSASKPLANEPDAKNSRDFACGN